MQVSMEPLQKRQVLFVDDEPAMLKAMKRFSRDKNWHLHLAGSGKEGLSLIDLHDIDVVISDMKMPEMSGYEFLTKVKELKPNSSRILLTGYSDIDSLRKTINEAGLHNYIPKPWDDALLRDVIDGALQYQNERQEKKRLEKITKEQKNKLGRLALSLDKQVKEKTIEIEQAMTLLQRSHNNLQKSFHETLEALIRIIEWKEGRDDGHSRFVSKYAVQLAERAGLSATAIENVRIAGMLHRIGMNALPDEVRSKAVYLLDNEELLLYRRYPVWGQMALANVSGLQGVADIIRHIHEHVNGKGFPDKIFDKNIPVESKIIGLVCDFYDLYSGRLERNLKGIKEAQTYILEWAGKKYEADLVNILIEISNGMLMGEPKLFVVSADEIEEDLVLAKDLILSNGIMLLSKGTYLCEKSISQIKHYEANLNMKIELVVSRVSQESEVN